MKFFKIVWLDRKVEVLQGENIHDAFYKAGYKSVLRYIDFYKEVQPPKDGWIELKRVDFGFYGTKIIYTHKDFPFKKVIMNNKIKYQY